MKKQTMYNRLKKQYAKLNQSIQKAMQTGRFYAYTQFKQEQLLSRLKRCSFQLKQLGAGVAVVGALGMATPAVGQTYDFVERTGAANPFNIGASGGVSAKGNLFVDIDGDGDQDLFLLKENQLGYNMIASFYENTGSATAPAFTLQTGSNNPLDTFTDKSVFSFVDIDGDGDQDLFTSRSPRNYATTECEFYENTGSSTTPVFTLQTSTNNPLDSVVTHAANLNFAGEFFAFFPSFVDIDGDGDQDCFMGVYSFNINTATSTLADNDKLWYYENVGTATSPNFQRQSFANHPVASLFSTSIVNGEVKQNTQFFDIDKDGDYDMITNFSAPQYNTPRYFRNEGTPTNPNMVSLGLTGTPIDSLYNNAGTTRSYFSLVDIDGDGDLDAKTGAHLNHRYFENITPLSLSILPNNKEVISVYPNPTTGKIFLEEAITGQLQIFNDVGQEVYTKELEQAQEINLSSLEAGLYLIYIKEDKKYLQQTIVIQK